MKAGSKLCLRFEMFVGLMMSMVSHMLFEDSQKFELVLAIQMSELVEQLVDKLVEHIELVEQLMQMIGKFGVELLEVESPETELQVELLEVELPEAELQVELELFDTEEQSISWQVEHMKMYTLLAVQMKIAKYSYWDMKRNYLSQYLQEQN